MFGSEILDVAIGLTLIFLLMSLVASAVREGIEGIVKLRAVYLERGIRELLDDPSGTKMAQWLYQHPLVHPLFPGHYEPLEKRHLGRKMPTYIPAKNFVGALLDLTRNGPAPYPAPQAPQGVSVADLRNAVRQLPSPLVQRALISAIDGAQGDMARVEANLAAWFDSTMDTVSGWYKRRTQLHLFVIGLAVALALNVNTIGLAMHLWRNDAAREALARRAEMVAQDTAYQRLARDTTSSAANERARYEALAALDSLDLPIGWGRGPSLDPVAQILGLLLTAFAIMLGAPFWFDVLNKIGVVRSTVKPREKSPEEASEDRQRPTSQTASPQLPPPPAPPPSQPPPQPRSSPPASAAQPAPTAAGVAALGTLEEWDAGTPDEGIL
jgi:hypothetical protein